MLQIRSVCELLQMVAEAIILNALTGGPQQDFQLEV